MGYTKHIAVIKGLKDGFSADGGALSGLVKCERYGSKLSVGVSLINFAPLTEGRYVCAISDGKITEIFDNREYDGASGLDISSGFAALICYVNAQVSAIASAICSGYRGSVSEILREVEKSEPIKCDGGEAQAAAVEEYSDEAIAEVNYYEYEQAAQSQGAVCAGESQTHTRDSADKNEENSCAKEKRGGKRPFYKRVQSEVEGILKTYPAETEAEKIFENSRWVRIDYGEGKYYIFGVLYKNAVPEYFAYGVPAESETPPESLGGLASFVPSGNGRGYWVMYQNAGTGDSIAPATAKRV